MTAHPLPVESPAVVAFRAYVAAVQDWADLDAQGDRAAKAALARARSACRTLEDLLTENHPSPSLDEAITKASWCASDVARAVRSPEPDHEAILAARQARDTAVRAAVAMIEELG